ETMDPRYRADAAETRGLLTALRRLTVGEERRERRRQARVTFGDLRDLSQSLATQEADPDSTVSRPSGTTHDPERVVHDGQCALELGVCGDHRRDESEDVQAAVTAANLEDEPVVEAMAGDRLRLPVGGRLAHAIAHQLDAQQHAAAAHVA